jgi:RTX calcium-binding nonapeptide repeat (4 copies)
MRRFILLFSFLLLSPIAILPAAIVSGKTSHAGWPHIDVLLMNKDDADRPLRGIPFLHNELLGGHGNDTLYGGNAGDVLWGDYKPSGQPTTQVDHIYAGDGNDFIYASHGTNFIFTGGGRDIVHAHFGRGEIHCQSPLDVVYLSHVSQRGYKLFGCSHISFATLGY